MCEDVTFCVLLVVVIMDSNHGLHKASAAALEALIVRSSAHQSLQSQAQQGVLSETVRDEGRAGRHCCREHYLAEKKLTRFWKAVLTPSRSRVSSFD